MLADPTLTAFPMEAAVGATAIHTLEVLTMTTKTSSCHPGEGSKALYRLPKLADPLLQFDLQEEL